MIEGYEQVCIWPGCTLGDKTPQEFEEFMKSELGVDVKFLEIVFTNPDLDETGKPVPDTGGRSDLFFALKDADVPKFAVPRLEYGIRWLEDAIYYNNNEHLYPKKILETYPKRW